MSKLSHLDAQGNARMINVSNKPDTRREARAEAERENMDRIGQYLAGDAVFSLAHSK